MARIALGEATGQFRLLAQPRYEKTHQRRPGTEEYAQLLKSYRTYSVTGDHYTAAWVSSAWTKHGISYRQSNLSKSEIYLECAPLFARGLVRLPNHPKLLRELRLLERRVHRSGKDSVDHGRNGHDDHANAVCGVLQLLSGNTYVDLELWNRAYG
jgi:hypothetical protein